MLYYFSSYIIKLYYFILHSLYFLRLRILCLITSSFFSVCPLITLFNTNKKYNDYIL